MSRPFLHPSARAAARAVMGASQTGGWAASHRELSLHMWGHVASSPGLAGVDCGNTFNSKKRLDRLGFRSSGASSFVRGSTPQRRGPAGPGSSLTTILQGSGGGLGGSRSRMGSRGGNPASQQKPSLGQPIISPLPDSINPVAREGRWWTEKKPTYRGQERWI